MSEVGFNLCNYIGKGIVKEKISMTGAVYCVEFEVAVENDEEFGERMQTYEQIKELEMQLEREKTNSLLGDED